ncbi:hypothetical protein [Nocardia sp. CNY236]|uniref:hypothetical protein n=1 Tax=Nocardia sp. CNY236 TaxID=1169152 RepID=UPI000687482C|nr:hypothetical protein [Nocardia sp. CNY236]
MSPSNDDSAISRISTATAHWMPHSIVIMIAVRGLPHVGLEHWSIHVGGTLAFLACIVGFMHNQRAQLCVRCMSEVPTDPGTRAERWRLLLWINHQIRGIKRILILLAIMTGTLLVATASGFPRLVYSLTDLLTGLYMYSVWLHHRLRPWCPYCRDWDDDDVISEPSPDPVAENLRD